MINLSNTLVLVDQEEIEVMHHNKVAEVENLERTVCDVQEAVLSSDVCRLQQMNVIVHFYKSL